MASKKPPPGFDPHPGDPWHPDWTEDEPAAETAAEADAEEPWWRRALHRGDGPSDRAPVPTVYASLEESPPAEPAPGAPAKPAPEPPKPAVVAPPTASSGGVVSLDHLLFSEDAAASEITAKQEPAVVGPTDDVEAVHNWAINLGRDARARKAESVAPSEPEPEPEPVVEAMPVAELEPEPVPEPEPVMAAMPVAELEPEPVPVMSKIEHEMRPAAPSPEELRHRDESLAAAAATRAQNVASELMAGARLDAAEMRAHEEASMWTAVGAARRAEDEARSAARRLESRPMEPRADTAALAEEARTIEAARMEFVAARQKTEAEVRHALDQPLPDGANAADEAPLAAAAGDVGARFAALAAQLQQSDDAEHGRFAKREQLRMRTSLLVLDAEQPWDVGGWSRPGSSLGAKSVVAVVPIADGSASSVPESAPKRRWALPRKRKTPPGATSPQGALRSVVVVEERRLSGKEDELESTEQEPLPFDELSSPSPDSNGDLEDDLTAWSDLDWDFTESPSATDSPDSATSHEDRDVAAADKTTDDWEPFSAGEYVQPSTHEYADLAAAVAASEAEAPQQAALAADMPGLESSLVSLDDVVAAEGMERAEAAPHKSDLAVRVLTAVGLIALFFASLTFQWSIGLLVLAVMTVAAGELATVLRRTGYHPVALFAYLGTIGALLGAWVYGPVAIPVAVGATVLVVVLFFGLVTGRQEPLLSMALTVLIVLWVGVFGAFAYDLVAAAEYRWLIASLVLIVAAMDVAQYFVGKRIGKRPLAPVVSPKKTIAGLVGGVVVAVGVGYGLSFLAPFDAVQGLVLGATLAVTGPLGDLAVSVLKRAINVKDMGTILPGHGGVVDRIDAILFSLPAAWVVYAWAGLLV